MEQVPNFVRRRRRLVLIHGFPNLSHPRRRCFAVQTPGGAINEILFQWWVGGRCSDSQSVRQYN